MLKKSAIVFLITPLVSLFFLGNSQVVGVDFGTEFWKASLVSPGRSMSIVENSRSGRKSINAIAFQKGMRYFQDDAWVKRIKKPSSAYFQLRSILGKISKGEPINGFDYINGTYVAAVEDKKMTIQQLVAMVLKKIRQYAAKQAQIDVLDTVITVPSNWDFMAKTALYNAGKIAGMSVMSVINENSAAALQYALTRNDSEPISVLIFNLGSSCLQISIFRLWSTEIDGRWIESVKALSHVTVNDIGGYQIDELLAQQLAKYFEQKYKIKILKDSKAYAKLLFKTAEVKEILSANRETKVYVEGLSDGIDLNSAANRQSIDKFAHWNKIEKHLDQALKLANLTKQQISQVQMIGGGIRIPKVNEIVKQYFPETTNVGSHINGDESMAFGASFLAANLSRVFRVKPIHFYDGHLQQIKYVIYGESVISEGVLFTQTDFHGTFVIKALPLPQNDVKISLFIGEDLVKEQVTVNISEWRSSVPSLNNNKSQLAEEPILILVFMMSSIQGVQIKQAYLNVTLNTTEIKQVLEFVNDTDSQNKTQEATQNAQINETADSSEKLNQKVDQFESNTSTRLKSIKVNKTQFKISTKKVYVHLETLKSKYVFHTPEQIRALQKSLNDYQQHQKEVQLTSKARNDLDQTLYSLSENMEHPTMSTFGKIDQIENLKNVAQQIRGWNDEQGYAANRTELQAKLQALYEAYYPMYNRSLEFREREGKVKEVSNMFDRFQQKLKSLSKSHYWMQEQIKELQEKTTKTIDELNKLLKEQSQRDPKETPLFYNHELGANLRDLQKDMYRIRSATKPKSNKPKKPTVENEDKVVQNEKQSSEDPEKMEL